MSNKQDRDPRFAFVGPNIQYYRRVRGLTQAELAEQVGYHNRTAVSRVETGEFIPPLPKLERFADALGVTVPDLLRNPARPSGEDLETAGLRQEAFDDYQTLFSLSSKATPEQLKSTIEYLRFLTRNNDPSDSSD